VHAPHATALLLPRALCLARAQRRASGNEGYGLRPLVKRCCTQLVQIEMAPTADTRQQQQLVDSLNVSVATGILLHHLMTAARSA
jgi:21S rRNA (GM2251-2'-O)-methyltransferase